MFYKCSNHSRACTLNAIPPPPLDPTQAQHRADNLAACLEIRDLSLQLARAAAARALAAASQPPTPEPAAKPADPDLAYARHASSVRQSVELWEKITANAFARRHQPRPEQAEPDPDLDLDDLLDEPELPEPAFSETERTILFEAVANLALLHPSHAEIPETLNQTIEQTLAAHPEDHVSANFARICQTFGLPPDRARLQPHLESQLRPPPGRWPKLE